MFTVQIIRALLVNYQTFMLFIAQERDLAVSGVSVITAATADIADAVKKDILGWQIILRLL